MMAYLNSDEPTVAMTATDVLIGLTILSKVHVEMVLHVLLSTGTICEADTTLFTLDR